MNPESGKEYLRRLGENYNIAKKSLPGLSENDFNNLKNNSSKREIGVESFLMDFAIAAEERRRNLERWAKGKEITPATAEHAKAIISALPTYSIADSEVLGMMRTERVKSFKIDAAVEDILTEISQRLPRRIEAYKFHQDYAKETINIPGIGEIKVTMHETGNGIFKDIGEVEGETFRIWNCRKSGVKYMNKYSDISRPSNIEIKPKQLKIELYDDESGIFVTKQGKRFTNARWRTASGSGYDSDAYRDDLHRTYSGGNEDDSRYRDINNNWEKDKTVLSWKKVEDEAIIWLAENVLNPFKQAPKTENQKSSLPEEEPFPEGKIGPIFTFVGMQDLRRIELIKNNPKNAYPEERKAIAPNERLVPYGIPLENVSEIANDGFIWCGVGAIDENTNMDSMKIGRETRKTDRIFGDNEGLAVIKPKTATDVYVVDWQAWDDFREEKFTTNHDTLTDDEVAEMYRALARTLVPIADFKGDYKNPIVLIGRDLELDEVQVLHLLPPEEKNK
jgi:hypothetical protein